MRISLILELLIIFVLLAFAASKPTDNRIRQTPTARPIRNPPAVITDAVPITEPTEPDILTSPISITPVKNQTKPEDKFCTCSKTACNCCRNFAVPVLGLRGPGCATLQYVKGDNMIISMSFADRVITNTTISGRKPEPVCMPLPGRVSKFCGRVYNIGRSGDEFKACLGLELHALRKIEAALRVSCFKFGSNGLRVEPSQPLPTVNLNETDDDDDDDDEEDDDEDEDDFDLDEDIFSDDAEVDSTDYSVFGVFGDDVFTRIFETEYDDNKKPVNKNKIVKTTTKKPQISIRKPVAPVIEAPTKNTAVIKPIVKQTNNKIRATTKPPKLTTTKSKPVLSTKKPQSSSTYTTPKPSTEIQKTTAIINTTTIAIPEITTIKIMEDLKTTTISGSTIAQKTTETNESDEGTTSVTPISTTDSTETTTQVIDEDDSDDEEDDDDESDSDRDRDNGNPDVDVSSDASSNDNNDDDEEDEDDDDGSVPNYILRSDDADSSLEGENRELSEDDTYENDDSISEENESTTKSS